jgi:riboflavin kinase/FMN adenylyltransferase
MSEQPPNAVVTIGNFDGVHLGHQAIFKRVMERAGEIGGKSVVYTFDPHPLKILAPEQSLNLICAFKKKMELIAKYGIDMTVCADFTREFARMHPRDFAQKLMAGLGMDTVVVGHDYSFGHGKTGTIEYLTKMGKELGFIVEVIDAVVMDNERISSTIIRELIDTGDINKSNRFLNRCYSIAGKVVSGYKRGKAIGFPTANLDTPYEVIPAVGVYAVLVSVKGGDMLDGVVNIGYNPTFDRDDFIVEVHLLNYDNDIYGVETEIYFIERLRDERNFENVAQLQAQIKEDIQKASSILKNTRQKNDCIAPTFDHIE